jgi:hypothetical protein
VIVLWLIVDERIASAYDRLVEDIRCMLTQGACFALIDQFSNLLVPLMIELNLVAFLHKCDFPQCPLFDR